MTSFCESNVVHEHMTVIGVDLIIICCSNFRRNNQDCTFIRVFSDKSVHTSKCFNWAWQEHIVRTRRGSTAKKIVCFDTMNAEENALFGVNFFSLCQQNRDLLMCMTIIDCSCYEKSKIK